MKMLIGICAPKIGLARSAFILQPNAKFVISKYTIPPFTGSKYFIANTNRCADGETPCAICGRGVRSPWPHIAVVINGGASWGGHSSNVTAKGYMGYWPVGEGCHRNYGGKLRMFDREECFVCGGKLGETPYEIYTADGQCWSCKDCFECIRKAGKHGVRARTRRNMHVKCYSKRPPSGDQARRTRGRRARRNAQ